MALSSRHLVDPQLAAGIDAMPPYHRTSAQTLGEMRALVENAARTQVEVADASGVEVSEQYLPAVDGSSQRIRVAIYRPPAMRDVLPAFFHIHGGGMVMGRPEMRHASLLSTAREIPCLVASIDYRLAPEAPFPASLEDCYASLRWLHAQALTIGIDPKRIAIGGESAGGGIAAGLALLARDRGEVPVIVQMLTYPMLDDRTAVADNLPAHVGEFVWGREANRFGWRSLLACEPGAHAVSPYAAPARCQSLEGLPPAFIAVGALDLFMEEDLEYARRLSRAGVPTELHLYPGAFHAFDAVPDAEIAGVFRTDWLRALRRAFRVASNPSSFGESGL
jgi:acetyl esterase/lipase